MGGELRLGVFYYVEIFRQIYPSEDLSVYKQMDFFVFGEFDGMYVQKQRDCIASLKQLYEKRHEGSEIEGPVPDTKPPDQAFLCTDRQPIFLYSPDNKKANDLNSPKMLFKSDSNNTFPFVLTLFQLDKKKMKQLDLDAFLSGCCDSINEYIKNLPACNGCESESPGPPDCRKLYFDVFLNLGEADLAVVFRAEYLQCVARLLENIRSFATLNEAPILSLSSYYGFPRTDDWENNIKIWLERESRQSGSIFQLNMLYDIPLGEAGSQNESTSGGVEESKENSKGDTAQSIGPSFVFGEWDYLECWNDPKNVDAVVSMLQRDINLHWMSNSKICIPEKGQSAWRRSSNIIATFKWPNLRKSGGSNQNIVNIHAVLESIRKTDKILGMAFKNLIKVIEKTDDFFGKLYIDNAIEMLKSLSRTISGLLGFLARLYIGRFEQDLYQYISPVFLSFDKIIMSYKDLIVVYSQIRDADNDNLKDEKLLKTSNLIDECIRDTGELITRLQQIYTVLGVSPHTFMETYGSSMRSLSASSKLIGAYQGMLRYIEKRVHTSKVDETYAILLTPYRQTQPSNRLLYSLSSPSNRIASIQVDYTKLFSSNTVFMLLHECAHTLSDRKREERFSFFAEAWTMMIFYNAFGYWYTQPIEALVFNVMLDESDQNKQYPGNVVSDKPGQAENTLFYGIDGKERFENRIREKMSRYVNDTSKRISEKMRIEFNDSQKHSLHKDQMREVNEWVRRRLEDKYFDNESIMGYGNKIRELVAPMAEAIKKYISENNGNVREAIRVESLYKRHDSVEELIRKFPDSLNKLLNNPKAKESLSMLFQDVYADLFAIMILDGNMNADKYIDALIEFFGVKTLEFLTDNDYIFMRIMTIAEAMGWPVKSGDPDTGSTEEGFIDKFIKRQSIPDDFARELRRKWDRIEALPYRQPVLEYVKMCKKVLHNQVVSLENDHDGVRQAIRDLWKNLDGETEEAIRLTAKNIYILWNYLMSNGIGIENSYDS